jgi:hypothetical protein
MLSEGWLDTETPTRVSRLAGFLSPRTAYRLHEIVVGPEGERAVATVYDGREVVYRAHGLHEAEALERAHQWIDEQAASLPAFDLHVG